MLTNWAYTAVDLVTMNCQLKSYHINVFKSCTLTVFWMVQLVFGFFYHPHNTCHNLHDQGTHLNTLVKVWMWVSKSLNVCYPQQILTLSYYQIVSQTPFLDPHSNILIDKTLWSVETSHYLGNFLGSMESIACACKCTHIKVC